MASTNSQGSGHPFTSPHTFPRKFFSDENGNRTKNRVLPIGDPKKGSETGKGLAIKNLSAPGTMKAKARKYDIPTLLNIRHQLEHNNNLAGSDLSSFCGGGRRSFGSGSGVLTERSINHTRMTSDSSCHTVQFPQRQPRNAPQGNLAQLNEGFARFLKEHSSPKHHRVTAGGRIVPMDVQPPDTPEFKLVTKCSDIISCLNTPTVTKVEDTLKPPKKEESKGERTTQRHGKSRAANEKKGSDPGRRRDLSANKSSTASTAFTTGEDQCHGPAMIAPSSAIPVTAGQVVGQNPFIFNPGLAVNLGQLSLDGISVPANQTDQTTSQLPNFQQCYSPVVLSQFSSESVQSLPQTQFISNMGIYSTTPAVAMINPMQFYQISGIDNSYINTATPGVNTIPPINNRGLNNALENAIQEFDNFSVQLSSLDRYMALHAWDIDQTSKKVLVAQRIELVTKLDTARVLKENLEAALRINSADKTSEVSVLPGYTNFNDQNNATATPSTPNQNSRNNLQQFGHPVADGTPFTQNELNCFASPKEINGTPYSTTESLYSTGFQDSQTENQNTRTANLIPDWAGNCVPPTTAASNFSDDDSMKIITTASGEMAGEPISDWVAPPELSVIYQKIEKAAKRNEALGPLFQELTRATALMNSSVTGTNSDIEKNNFQDLQWNYLSECQGEIPSSALSGSGYGKKSEQHWPLEPHDYQRKNILDVAKSHNLYLTGTNQTDEHYSATNVATSQSNYRQNNLSTRMPLNTTGKPALTGPLSSVRKSTGPRGTPQHSALSFTPCRQNGQNEVSRKVGTFSAAQKINAQGFLPPFDGSSDATERNSSSAQTTNQAGKSNNNNNVSMNTAGKMANSDTSFDSTMNWPSSRPNPNAMDVRAFFQLLRDEDREAIRKYQNERRAFG